MTAQSESLPVRSTRRRKKVRTPSSQGQRPQESAPSTAVAATEPGLRLGWRIVAAKEFSDHLTSWRFFGGVLVLALAGAGAVYSVGGGLSNVASQVSGAPSVFLALFTGKTNDLVPRFYEFIEILGPLLGIAFGFDAINSERSEGTLPRLLSQPIHRDDVINGKFVAGLAAIGVTLAAVIGIVSAIGIIQLGILPGVEDVLRMIIWFVVALTYIGFWLALAILFSVLLHRAATSAIASLAVWFLTTAFFALIITLLANVISPVPADAGQTSEEARQNLVTQYNLSRVNPNQLYDEATRVLLDPRQRTANVSLVTASQASGTVGSLLSVDQSLLVIWPQFVALIAGTAVTFALAYVAFMRQEVRA